MLEIDRAHNPSLPPCFNEAAGADPADAHVDLLQTGGLVASMRPRGQTPRMRNGSSGSSGSPSCFNEAAGADPADADELGRASG